MSESPEAWAVRVLDRCGPVDVIEVAERVLRNPSRETCNVTQIEVFGLAAAVLSLAPHHPAKAEEDPCTPSQTP